MGPPRPPPRPRNDWATRDTIGSGYPLPWQGPVLVPWMPFGVSSGTASGYKSPKCWACWPAAQPLRGPAGLLKEVLLIERAGTKVLGWHVVQCTAHAIPEAGSQVGEV